DADQSERSGPDARLHEREGERCGTRRLALARKSAMNETVLENLLAAVRGRLQDADTRRGALPDLCLTFERARTLALDPARWREDERAHAAGCRLCRLLVVGIGRLMPHASFWTLLRSQLGLLSGHEQCALAYHVGPEACVRCA